MRIQRENCVLFFWSRVCLSLYSVDRFVQVCHIIALGAWVCGYVAAHCVCVCVCVEESLLFIKE